MKKIGVTGSTGKLGSLLVQMNGFYPLICDITQPKEIEEELNKVQPDLIVHAAGISSIDECEKYYDKAIKVNVHGTHNLFRAFGNNILVISSDQVFDGKSNKHTEKDFPSPINNYGMTKLGQEADTDVWGGKVIRLSRTVSIEDRDISDYLLRMYKGEHIQVPSFIHRNYVHRAFVIEALRWATEHFDSLPKIVNYGGTENISFFTFMLKVAEEFGFDESLLSQRKEEDKSMSPRPLKGGYSVALAKKLGFPMFSINDTVLRLAKEANLP